MKDSLKALQTIAGFWRKKLNVRGVGITGSVGKSTTKELVAEVLGQRYHTLKNQGNLTNEIGLPLTLLDDAAVFLRGKLAAHPATAARLADVERAEATLDVAKEAADIAGQAERIVL